MRAFYHAISENHRYALDYGYAWNMVAAMQLITSGQLKFDPAMFEAKAATQSVLDRSMGQSQPAKRVAVIPIHGTMFMHDQACGPKGMQTIGRWIQAADNDDSVDGIMLDIYSPGGQVDYTETLGDIVSATQKPIGAFCNQLMASGAYWIGSHADFTWASGRSARIGSIGVMVTYNDMTQMMKNAGVEPRVVRSTLSPDKNAVNLYDPTEKDIALLQEQLLDPAARIFHDVVRANRPNLSEEALTGKTYYAEQALELGLIDQIGTMDEAIEELLGMTGGNNKVVAEENFDSFKFKLPAPSKKSNSTEKTMNENQVTVAELQQQLADARLANQALQATAKATQGAFDRKVEELTAANAENASLKATIKELEAETPAPPAAPQAPRAKSHLDGVDPKYLTDADRKLAARLAQ